MSEKSDVRLPGINTVVIDGRLTRDPAQRPGGPVTFGLANARYYKDKSGERQEDTTFIDVEVWGQGAEYVRDNLAKGDPVLVEGRLKYDAWEAADGSKRSQIRVAFARVSPLSWKKHGKAQTEAEEQPKPRRTAIDDAPVGEEDLPF